LKRPDARVLDIATVCPFCNPVLTIPDSRAQECTSPSKVLISVDDDRWAIEMADMFPQYVLIPSTLISELVF
jgi:hypothetical protein